MKRINVKTEEFISHMRAYFLDKISKPNYTNEPPLRSELFTSSQMEQFGKVLAEGHHLTSRRKKDKLLDRLSDNEKILMEFRVLLTEWINLNYPLAPAGEWLMDNFYLIEEQIRIAKRLLPKGYIEELPQLDNDSAGVTRIYDISLQIISHSDGRIDMESMSRFINAYQGVTPLKIGELWAISIMLRLALIENLRRVSALIAIDRTDRNLADLWSKRIIESEEKEPQNLIITIADMTRSNPKLTSPFVAEMVRQLSGKGPGPALALNWIEERLAEKGTTSAELIAASNQHQAAEQVSVRNSIGSLRLLSTIDWRDFVEGHSIVEQILKKDSAGIYPAMDFNTRDRYRHVVEKLSKRSKLSEPRIAEIVVEISNKNAIHEVDKRISHIGYYLIGEGIDELLRLARIHKTIGDVIKTFLKKNAFFFYFTLVILLTLAATYYIFKYSWNQPVNGLIVTVIILSLFCTSQLAQALINLFSALFVKPQLLPRMDFSKGIPEESLTLVVIPVMLTTVKDIDEIVEALEVRYLANRNENLKWGLLTDFTDAKAETVPGDMKLEKRVVHGVEALNKKYGIQDNNLFYLFHRPRRWNPVDKVWMGWERKRGKLSELNVLLRGHGTERFSKLIGKPESLLGVKYVITLDIDTKLPLGAAWKLTATMAHPLNHPIYSEKKRRVVDGYGILQPRVSTSLPELTSSRYSKLHSNEPGIDPYTRAISDTYQDLFGEGSFIGKGIYQVDMFEKVVSGRFPENRILSHDLLEGCYVRSGYMSDVQLFEKYPETYIADVKRRARWIRGDWQIATWFLPIVPDAKWHWKKNPLSALSRWKIFDNLRRSLVPLALMLLIIIGWAVLIEPVFWTIVVVLIVVLPVFLMFISDLFKKPAEIAFRHHIILSSLNAGGVLSKTVFMFISLPHEAWYSLVAVFRSTWRMIFSHRKLLEWNPFNLESISSGDRLRNYYMAMWFAPVLSFALLIYLINSDSFYLPIEGPILFIWFLAPFITWHLSGPVMKKVSKLSKSQINYLRSISRKTWGFFERFVTEADNWLPPDNFQEHPKGVIAHRTSPTNIGLYLLANLSAYDLGYQSDRRFVERAQNTFDTLSKLEKFKGHLLNWYDSSTLQPLTPVYVSSVDSGNMIGHMLTLKQGLLEIPNQKIVSHKFFDGLQDTFAVFMKQLNLDEQHDFKNFKTFLEKIYESPPSDIKALKLTLEKLFSLLPATKGSSPEDAEDSANWWKGLLTGQLADAMQDLKLLDPWYMLGASKYDHITTLKGIPSLQEVLKKSEQLFDEIEKLKKEDQTEESTRWFNELHKSLTESVQIAKERVDSVKKLVESCEELANAEWDFLYDENKNLLTVGFRVEENKKDHSYYDLLASEARFCSFVGIARGKLPEESWFALGRPITNSGTGAVLLSWSGSMFEYLMPLLVMPTYENTLLDQTYKKAVDCQIRHGNDKGVPWGNSESGYNMVDAASNYQYMAFGTPKLGLKRSIGEDLVVAPYASMLALMVEPEKSCKNLELMSGYGFEGNYGFYEAVDYTPARLHTGKKNAIIRSYMAHHQGMNLLALNYLLLNQPMQKRFEAEPEFKACLLLLQERIPKQAEFHKHIALVNNTTLVATGAKIRSVNTPNTPVPEIKLLSNGKYNVMVTNSGGGYSRWKDLLVTRWREDTTRDNWGTFCYIRDLESNAFWSSTFQPTHKKVKKYEATYSQSRADYRGTHYDIEAHTEIVVSPEDDIEMRRLHLTNHSLRNRIIEITSYAEVVLAPADADAMHQAFSNLFVETQIIKDQHAILCTRRPRTSNEQQPWMFHLMTADGPANPEISFETDRMEFIGRGNTPANPKAMYSQGPLSQSQGSVLDPIVAIRYKFTLKPKEIMSVDVITGMGETKKICEALIDKYHDRHHKNRVFELAWTHNQVILRHINSTETDAQLYSRLAGSVIYANSSLRADPSILIKNQRGQSGLWGYSISGDLPIVLVQIEDPANINLVKQMIQAHTYWHLKGLIVDLVIVNEDHGGYRQMLQNQIQSLIAAEVTDKPGGIFLRSAEQISNEDKILFQTVARVILSDSRGTLNEQVNFKPPKKINIPYIKPAQESEAIPVQKISLPSDLQFFNGFGGFNARGDEYVMEVSGKSFTPAPWSNVIANSQIGTVISESGSAYTWAENAHQFRLSTWYNDPICDVSGEVFYIRDEASGNFWSATPLPRCTDTPYVVRHGRGYSVFENISEGVHTEMCVFVDLELTVKYTTIKVRNVSGKQRSLSVTAFAEWVLGDLRQKTSMHIFTEQDPTTGALFVRNPYNSEFPGRVVFMDSDGDKKLFTCDRTEFIGRNGSLHEPDAMKRESLSGKSGAGLDPCGVIQIKFDLAAKEEREIVFRMGAANSPAEASDLVQRTRDREAAAIALQKVKDYWNDLFGAFHVETPDAAINLLANGWLTYQTLSSRLWGRSGYYQSGGAFGFRDQLQDVLSLLHADPKLGRNQILLAASRQFNEGDVQHWWHPPSGRGVRTRCSDDYLWLPFVTTRYIRHTGDNSILSESVHFLEGRLLKPDEESYYDLPMVSQQEASIYEHCVRAIRNGMRYGEHGLPLMGTGDWNDGMDRVGRLGKGESIWLGFFLYDILNYFYEIAKDQNDTEFAEECKREGEQLRLNLEKNGWDGEWFRRAYFDDGTPLGSSQNSECTIDSLPQSWSVISGASTKEKSITAMKSADRLLVHEKDAFICLLEPPFDKSDLDPGYIKGYVPGVRENGGQYTHAAIWMIIAFAKLGDKKRTWELLQIINPVNHGKTREQILNYKAEPYVIAADVYDLPPHVGRGGWTWYTGSASWMYLLITEFFLGIVKRGNKLHFLPCTPLEWNTFKIQYRNKETTYDLIFTQKNEKGKVLVTLDGKEQGDSSIELTDDGGKHTVNITLFSE